MIIGGLDVGTSGVKCVLFDENGTVLCRTHREYSYTSDGGQYCLDANNVLQKSCEVLSEAAHTVNSPIDGIGVSAIGESCVLLDENDRVLGNSILYNDHRGFDESEKIAARFGSREIFERTGIRPNGTYSIEKLMWIRGNEAYWDRVDKILLFEDFIIYKLTGNRLISYSLASRTMAFDVVRKAWDDEILDFAGVRKEWLSEPVRSGTCAGTVLPRIAEEYGLNSTLSVFTGGHDSWCCAIGGGLSEGITVNISGSGDTLNFLMDAPNRSKAMFDGDYTCSPTAYGDSFGSFCLCPMSGNLIRWFRDIMYPMIPRSEFYSYMERDMPSGPSGVIINPGFSASGHPCFRLRSEGVISGLTTKTTPFRIYKGLMESVAMHLRANRDYFLKHGIKKLENIRSVGGGSTSAVWMQIKADILGESILTLESFEAGAAGCAILSGVGCGFFADIAEAQSSLIKPGKLYEPDKNSSERYEEEYVRFIKQMEAYSEVYKDVYRT